MNLLVDHAEVLLESLEVAQHPLASLDQAEFCGSHGEVAVGESISVFLGCCQVLSQLSVEVTASSNQLEKLAERGSASAVFEYANLGSRDAWWMR